MVFAPGGLLYWMKCITEMDSLISNKDESSSVVATIAMKRDPLMRYKRLVGGPIVSVEAARRCGRIWRRTGSLPFLTSGKDERELKNKS